MNIIKKLTAFSLAIFLFTDNAYSSSGADENFEKTSAAKVNSHNLELNRARSLFPYVVPGISNDYMKQAELRVYLRNPVKKTTTDHNGKEVSFDISYYTLRQSIVDVMVKAFPSEFHLLFDIRLLSNKGCYDKDKYLLTFDELTELANKGDLFRSHELHELNRAENERLKSLVDNKTKQVEQLDHVNHKIGQLSAELSQKNQQLVDKDREIEQLKMALMQKDAEKNATFTPASK